MLNLSKIPLVKRILPSIIKRISRLINIRVKVVRNKAYFLLNLKNQHDRALYLNKHYEPEQINFLKDNINLESDFTTFIDVGACIGFYSLSISRLCSNISEVFLFEPNIENYNCAKKNLELNDKVNNFSHIYNFGLSNINERKKLYTLKANDGAGGSISEFKDQYKNTNAISFDIEVKIGDDILKLEDKKIALKIDVERHELNVLKGISNLLKLNKCLIQIEIFDNYLSEVRNFLNKLGYKEFHEISHNYSKKLSDYYFKNY